MPEVIEGSELWTVELPAGRVIGDCTCHYDSFDVLAICLKTNRGRCGWGFGETVSAGVFAKPAPWITSMPSPTDIRRDFERDFWPSIEGRTPFELAMQRPRLFSAMITSLIRKSCAVSRSGRLSADCASWLSPTLL